MHNLIIFQHAILNMFGIEFLQYKINQTYMELLSQMFMDVYVELYYSNLNLLKM